MVGRLFCPGRFERHFATAPNGGPEQLLTIYPDAGEAISRFRTSVAHQRWRTFVIQIRLRNALLAVAALAGLVLPPIGAQEPGTVPETKAPPQPAQQAPGKTISGHPADAYWTAHDKQLLTDFGWLAKYKEADLKLAAPAPDENRVVFMGDSITEGWHFEGPDGSFAGKPYINRGISGQTSPQMLVRFRQDVIELQPKVVVILAGTNDLAGNTGPMTLEQTEDNLASMADMATANHIRVVLCSVLPAYDFPWHPGLEPAPKIRGSEHVDQVLCRGEGLRVCGLSLGDEGPAGRIAANLE